VKDINPGSADAEPANLINVNGQLFFVATDPEHGRELWRSDGTEASTTLVADINHGSDSAFSNYSFQTYLVNLNGTLLMNADDGVTGRGLWRSDGTAEGTTQVTDIFPGNLSSDPRASVFLNGSLFFTTNTGTLGGGVLWKSDGTADGTTLVKDFGFQT